MRFLPDSDLEEFGVEDPRITALDGRFYFTYVSVSRHGAGTALASTIDFKSFDRHGMIFCPENKDVVLFPERIGGEYVALHRPNAATPFCRPEMWVARSPDLIHWGRHECLHGGGAEWETGRVGAGTPPVRVADGWLEIYHGNRQPTQPGEVGMYSTGVLLLDLENPARILRRTAASIFEPTADFERHGFVPDVVFPTGIVETPGSYLVYYGAADSCTAVVEFSTRRRSWNGASDLMRMVVSRAGIQQSRRLVSDARASSERSIAAASSSGRWLPIRSFDPSVSSSRTPRLPRAISARSPSRPDRMPQKP